MRALVLLLLVVLAVPAWATDSLTASRSAVAAEGQVRLEYAMDAVCTRGDVAAFFDDATPLGSEAVDPGSCLAGFVWRVRRAACGRHRLTAAWHHAGSTALFGQAATGVRVVGACPHRTPTPVATGLPPAPPSAAARAAHPAVAPSTPAPAPTGAVDARPVGGRSLPWGWLLGAPLVAAAGAVGVLRLARP